MTPTEMLTILDRDGVPVEARRVTNTTHDALCGAMLRWLIGEGYHSFAWLAAV